MSAVGEVIEERVPAFRVARTIKELSLIRSEACAAVIWRRQALPAFQSWIDRLDPARLPSARVVLRPEAVREAVGEICEISATPGGPERNWLIDDVARLADGFSGLMSTPWLRLRFDVVTTNACRKFHIDTIRARLICTYRGTGTQYAFATDGGEPAPIVTVPTGDPIILRGTLWPERPSSRLVHRSPPIDGTGETRSVLVLDPLDEPEDDL